mmetsp:Transcript_73287/g.158972  ORF Transcript_73287/g.158972 Transcript_73287/m.158972 type:complete len:126 (+) Transcript_73287:801-1178(+)
MNTWEKNGDGLRAARMLSTEVSTNLYVLFGSKFKAHIARKGIRGRIIVLLLFLALFLRIHLRFATSRASPRSVTVAAVAGGLHQRTPELKCAGNSPRFTWPVAGCAKEPWGKGEAAQGAKARSVS